MVATTGPVDSVTSVVMMTVLTFMISSSSSFASCRFTCAKTQWRRHLLFLPPSLIQYFLNTDKHQTKRQNKHDCYPICQNRNKLDHKYVSHNFLRFLTNLSDLSADQHIGLTCSLQYSSVRHSLGHDVSPDTVNLRIRVVFMETTVNIDDGHLVELPPLHGHLFHDVLAVEDWLEVKPRFLTSQPSIQYVLVIVE